ncbi:MAG TPA: biotin/lipoyl-binding protein [Ignavibacteriaceae bacterium]|nr:biotin/lipoyl-binding protein [Ignavibacteriaceae bacterium]
MKKFKFTIHGNKYDVNIVNVEDNIAEIEVNGAVYQVEVDKVIAQSKTPKLVRSVAVPTTESRKTEQRTSAPSSPKGTGFIKSPLPGVILDVYVKEGDVVKIGTKLLMLEAMKMENNINADKDGVVKSIKIKTGDSVLEGDTLIEIGA